MTILQILAQNNDSIRNASGENSITRITDAGLRDNVATELKLRGMLPADDTAALATISKDNTRAVVVKGVGLFLALETADVANNTTTFASADGGWLWEMAIGVQNSDTLPDGTTTDQDYEYTLEEGKAIWMVKVNPISAYGLSIGLTPGGNEITEPVMLVAGKWNTFRIDIDAETGDQPVLFEGVIVSTIFMIYKVSLPTLPA